MPRSIRSLVSSLLSAAAVLVVSLAFTTPAAAQSIESDGPTREGFWFNLGLGYGSLGCEDCSERTNGLSGGLFLGGTLNQRVLLGVGTSGWTKSEDGATLTVGALNAAIRFYPSATGNFFLTGGLGYGSVELGVSGFGSESATGASAILGLGYDIRVGRNVSITPFWNGFAVRGSDGMNANVGQIGIGLTTH